MFRTIFSVIAAVFLAIGASAQSYEEILRAKDLLGSDTPEQAIAILEPAARAGHPFAQNLLGAAYDDGVGVPRDKEAALNYSSAAADQGYPPALFNLGIFFARGGDGMAPDLDRSRALLERAVALDTTAAFGALAKLILETAQGPEDAAHAIDLLRRGAVRGDLAAIELLAYLMRSGAAGPQDPVEARHLYEIAALMGSVDAQMAVAGMFASGEGGPVDIAQAHAYFTSAANAGRADGLYARGLVTMMSPEEFDNGRVIGLAQCLAGADLLRRRDLAANCEERSEEYADSIRAAAQAEVPGLIETFVSIQQ